MDTAKQMTDWLIAVMGTDKQAKAEQALLDHIRALAG